MTKEKSDFIKHLERCKNETGTWPKWKRESIQGVKVTSTNHGA